MVDLLARELTMDPVEIRRKNFIPKDAFPYTTAGTLVYACTADEEEGSVGGARWLCANRPDLVKTDYVINEGGGHFLERAGRRVYLLESGEKGTAQCKLIVKGEAGHASVPLRSGNAVVSAARCIDALATHQLPLVIDGSSDELVQMLVDSPALRERLRDPKTARSALADLARRDVQLADMIEPLYGFQFSPTMVDPRRRDEILAAARPAGGDPVR
jgi:hypothetical protein